MIYAAIKINRNISSVIRCLFDSHLKQCYFKFDYTCGNRPKWNRLFLSRNTLETFKRNGKPYVIEMAGDQETKGEIPLAYLRPWACFNMQTVLTGTGIPIIMKRRLYLCGGTPGANMGPIWGGRAQVGPILTIPIRVNLSSKSSNELPLGHFQHNWVLLSPS